MFLLDHCDMVLGMDMRSLVLIADDPLARAGLAYMLTEQLDYKIIAQIHSHAWFDDLDLDDDPLPAAIVWDAGWELPPSAPDMMMLDLPVVVLVSDAELAAELWSAGLRVILRREAEPDQLDAAIQAAIQNLAILDPGFVAQISTVLAESEAGIQDSLTPRELEVLHLLAEGKTNKAIAQELDVSSHTVKFHVTSLLGKLNAQSRTEAVVRATRLGLIAL
jgi:two-component system, NarL family, nitrate/nitrite response regulator NarL